LAASRLVYWAARACSSLISRAWRALESLLSSRRYVIQKSAYLASTQDIDLDVRWEGFTRGLFGQGLFMVKVTGNGDLFVNSFGALDKHNLELLVAFSNTCEYEVRKFGSWKDTLFSGEGLVTYIEGPGEVYIQTKNLREFVDWIWQLIGPRVATRTSSR